MRTAILLSLLLAAGGGEGDKKKGGGHKGPTYPKGCVFVGLAQVDKAGHTSEVTGLALPKAGTVVQAFDAEGKLGRMKVSSSEADLRFAEGVPERVKSTAFSRVLLVDGSLSGVHVAQPESDLPKGVEAEQVILLLADHTGPRVAQINRPFGDDATQTCDQIACKGKGGWTICFSNCPKSDD